jgi:hypothetical protein
LHCASKAMRPPRWWSSSLDPKRRTVVSEPSIPRMPFSALLPMVKRSATSCRAHVHPSGAKGPPVPQCPTPATKKVGHGHSGSPRPALYAPRRRARCNRFMPPVDAALRALGAGGLRPFFRALKPRPTGPVPASWK